KPGEQNLLEADVSKHSANLSVNKAERTADFWVFGGIYRPVYLEAVPQQFIERVAINAQFDGSFAAEVFLKGAGDADRIEAQVTTLNGKPVDLPFSARISGDSSQLNSQFENIQQWTAETPNLYRIK